ncbi:molybdenum cofactor cytidylyltransferase [Cryobacterium levicorallinum]|uniref:Molybdenum cofactor cytidylyltransferase n=2 Tax=Cryobacterium levicorallinum TaxID=995038 RepID=A0ABY1EFB4_9MICO|nr:molybdenum cofactor cytidylyltransferase [Cryobacterium levicorallinum]
MADMHKPPTPNHVAGLVLAAGAGSRYGMPKALVHDASGRSWLQNAVDVLAAAGCSPVIVVLGARGAEAAALLKTDPLASRDGARARSTNRPTASVLVVQADDWAEGLSASLRAGLRCALDHPELTAIAVVPVDVPDLNAATVARLIGRTNETTDAPGSAAASAGTLRQARFSGQPGHPVVIGRSHWVSLLETLSGDSGARPYLRAHDVEAVECGDLGTGADVDRPREPPGPHSEHGPMI